MSKAPPLPRPTEGELAILSILWQRGPSTVREVYEAIGPASGYTTTLKLLQIMTEKGLVTRDESRRSHVYLPALRQEDTQRRLVGDLLDRVFGGSAKAMVLQALSAKPASAQELAQIRILVDDFAKKAGAR